MHNPPNCGLNRVVIIIIIIIITRTVPANDEDCRRRAYFSELTLHFHASVWQS